MTRAASPYTMEQRLVSDRRSAPHEGRARREAVGRPRAGLVPGGLHEAGGLPRRAGVSGHLGPRAPGDPQGAAGLRPGAQEVVAGFAPVRARSVRAQGHRGRGLAEAVRGDPPPLPRRRRADLRHRRRPRRGADLPLHPGAGRGPGEARQTPLAQLADRIGDPRRLQPPPPPLGLRFPLPRRPMPERGRLGGRPERDPVLHREVPGRPTALERRPGPDPRPGHDRPPRRRDPGLRPRAVLGAADPPSRRHLQIRQGPIRQGSGCESSARSGPGSTLHHQGRRLPPRARPAAPAPRPDRPPARDESPIRDVGRRHPQGRADALRIQAHQLSEDRLAPPGDRPQVQDPRHPRRPQGDQAGRGRQARPRPPPVRRPDRRRRQGRRPPRDHPHRQGPRRQARAGGLEGLRRHRGPPDRRVLPGLREGGDDRRRRVGRGPLPGPGGPGGRAGLDRPLPPEARPQGQGGRGGPPRLPPRRVRPPRAHRPPGGDHPPQALHRGDLAGGDGDGRQDGRRRGPARGPQGTRAGGLRPPGPRSSRPC